MVLRVNNRSVQVEQGQFFLLFLVKSLHSECGGQSLSHKHTAWVRQGGNGGSRGNK